MNVKSVVTLLLLLFVGASAVYLVIGDSQPTSTSRPATGPASNAPPDAPADATAPASTSLSDPAATTAADHPAQPADTAPKVIVYYFHSTQRCRTCLTIERLTSEALTAAFPDALAAGTLEWHAVNTDEPANSHFIKIYELVASSLVMVQRRDGADGAWVNLDRVWELVHDQAAFKEYVTQQARAYLEP